MLRSKDCIMGCIDKGCIEGVSRGASRVSRGCVEPLDADEHAVSIKGWEHASRGSGVHRGVHRGCIEGASRVHRGQGSTFKAILSDFEGFIKLFEGKTEC